MNNTFSSFGKIDGPACREEKDPEGNEELYISSACATNAARSRKRF
jgi:hypothetical protein